MNNVNKNRVRVVIGGTIWSNFFPPLFPTSLFVSQVSLCKNYIENLGYFQATKYVFTVEACNVHEVNNISMLKLLKSY